VPACFLLEEEDIAVPSWQFKGNQWWSKEMAPGRSQMVHSVRPKSRCSASQWTSFAGASPTLFQAFSKRITFSD
jgi:hypothetical protein